MHIDWGQNYHYYLLFNIKLQIKNLNKFRNSLVTLNSTADERK